jgi:transposase, IS30 family
MLQRRSAEDRLMAGTRMTFEERVRIEALWVAGHSIPTIADVVGRHRSTVFREVQRNNSYRHGPKNPRVQAMPRGRRGLYRWGYEARRASVFARSRTRRRAAVRLRRDSPLRRVVVAKLRQRWSPQQIAGWLAVEFPDRPEMRVSHETIYQAIYVQGRGNLRAELGHQAALRSGRARRRPQRSVAGAVRSGRAWTQEFHISTRPAEAADRAVPGHWEGDLVIGANCSSAIVTLVERSSRYAALGALPEGRVSAEVITVLTDLMGALPQQLRRSLTWDCGTELRRHAEFTLATDCQVYFCDPHSPWQRGSNENTNGLLRQYFPKGKTDFRRLSQADLYNVAAELNARPRQTLHWQTPAQALNEHLVASAS